MHLSRDGSSANGAGRAVGGATVVMGAGPGGLCSAYVLSKAGVDAVVLEKAPFVGGLARTIRRQTDHGEFRFDIGGHRWFTKNDELNDLFREVVAEELLWVNRVSRIYFDGKYVDYPLKISNALKAIGPVTAARAMADYGLTRARNRARPAPIVSMEDAYIDQFGTVLYRLFFQRYSEKVWGLPCDQMSGDWVSQRSKGMSLVTAVKDAVIPSRGKVVSLIDEFMYPKYGFGRFSERMADAITTIPRGESRGRGDRGRRRWKEGANRRRQFHLVDPADAAGQDRRSATAGRGAGRRRQVDLSQHHHRQPDAQEAASDAGHLALRA
jgi:hypothetical protein